MNALARENRRSYRRPDIRRRRGMTSMLAMLYLMLISTLALGFYAATTTQSQVANSEDRVARAYLAADSGMDFMRRVLAKVSLVAHAGEPGYPPVIDELERNLKGSLNGTQNLGKLPDGTPNDIKRVNNVIYIPGNQSFPIKLDNNGDSTFAVTITDWLGEIVVKIQGKNGTTSAGRAISLDFTRKQHDTGIYNFAVASKGAISVLKGAVTSTPGVDPKIVAMASELMSGTVITVKGTIGGNLSVMDPPYPAPPVSISLGAGASVGGSSVPSIINGNVSLMEPPAPEFPTLDPTVFKPYAVNNYKSGVKVQQNIIIKAGTNPTFNANDAVQGIMYIESPNQVTFLGDFKLQGFVVMEQSASTTDYLKFSGNLTMSPVPNDPAFDNVRATTGVAIMAPGAAVNMTGSSGGSIKGNIYANTFSFAGAAQLSIDQGSILTYQPTGTAFTMNSSKSIQFSATGAMNQPSQGATYSAYFLPKQGSYQEVMP